MNDTTTMKRARRAAIRTNCYVTGYIMAVYGWAFFVILVICCVINADSGG
jgi:hypothetical protein